MEVEIREIRQIRVDASGQTAGRYAFRWRSLANVSLRGKILLLFIFLGLIPLGLMGVLSYAIFYSSAWRSTNQAVIQTAGHIVLSTDILFHDTTRYLEIRRHDAVFRFLEQREETYPEAKEILKLFDVYRNAYKFDQSIRDILIIGASGKCISERRGVYRLDIDRDRFDDLFLQVLDRPLEVNIVRSEAAAALLGRPDEQLISIGTSIIHPVKRETLGIIVLKMDRAIVRRYCENIQIGKTGFYRLLTRGGDLLFSSEGGALRKAQRVPEPVLNTRQGSRVYRIDGRKMLVVHNTSELSGLKVVGFVPVREIMSAANQIIILTLIVLGIILVVIVVLFFFLSGRLTRPVRVMKDKFRQAAEGNLEVKIQVESSDEIADLGTSFNIMVEKIKRLLERNVEEHRYREKAELKLLQAQINPHFLYNTLDTIIWMAEGGENERVIDLVSALSSFFRASLGGGKDWVSIREEVEHVRSYLNIQKMRYEDILDYEIRVDEDIMSHRILKLIIQPLVENAIYHGIKNRRRKGVIRVQGGLSTNSALLFMVTDNGAGMSAEKLQGVLQNMEQITDAFAGNGDGRGFGLMNVNQRIRLYYGTEYGLSIFSQEGSGTRVAIRIPQLGQI